MFNIKKRLIPHRHRAYDGVDTLHELPTMPKTEQIVIVGKPQAKVGTSLSFLNTISRVSNVIFMIEDKGHWFPVVSFQEFDDYFIRVKFSTLVDGEKEKIVIWNYKFQMYLMRD